MDTQVRNSFDATTLKKIGKSALYCLTSALGAGIVAYAATKSLEVGILAGLGAFGTLLLKVVEEYKSGI